jgi:hypothetical protein
VSNLPFLSKILEKVVDVRIESHMKTDNLHEVNQSAYRKFHVPKTALLKVLNEILQSLDNNSVTILVMLDLSAAFDTIDRGTLLRRLERHFGITGKSHDIIPDRPIPDCMHKQQTLTASPHGVQCTPRVCPGTHELCDVYKTCWRKFLTLLY